MSIDYKTKLDAIQSQLKAANTTTAAWPLSKNMKDKVLLVTQSNPNYLIGQASKFPAISLILDNDEKEFAEIGRTSTGTKKYSTLNVKVIGMLWDDKFASEEYESCDREIHYLLENIEQVLRADQTLGNACLFSYPTSVKFYDILDEQSHFRAGVMDFKVKSLY